MPYRDRPPPPALDAAALERMALRYVERYATTRAKLLRYLHRKIGERGADGPIDPEALADRMVSLRYVDDAAFAEARSRAMTRRGLGARRIREALRNDGVVLDADGAVAGDLAADAVPSALAFARRRRIGPFAAQEGDRATRERWIGAMVRAGHSPGLARRIAAMSPDDDPASLDDTF